MHKWKIDTITFTIADFHYLVHQEDLCRLIALCGGNTIGSLRRAAICIGSPGRPTMNDIPAVKETWVLGKCLFLFIGIPGK